MQKNSGMSAPGKDAELVRKTALVPPKYQGLPYSVKCVPEVLTNPPETAAFLPGTQEVSAAEREGRDRARVVARAARRAVCIWKKRRRG